MTSKFCILCSLLVFRHIFTDLWRSNHYIYHFHTFVAVTRRIPEGFLLVNRKCYCEFAFKSSAEYNAINLSARVSTRMSPE